MICMVPEMFILRVSPAGSLDAMCRAVKPGKTMRCRRRGQTQGDDKYQAYKPAFPR
jgi:hypothetical protein